ncbi:hypothetical protein SLEP1_g13229 [Rubroshorea leprosula]|uniref:Uncharacterized protein n=1 Tax=Rubroshorea leprosula TaxID=152421 RepID=A0AAV5IPT8_9ROSI|nr:hypothetical protein SLEP1_g13229 [Rubroshorea leprosula]
MVNGRGEEHGGFQEVHRNRGIEMEASFDGGLALLISIVGFSGNWEMVVMAVTVSAGKKIAIDAISYWI